MSPYVITQDELYSWDLAFLALTRWVQIQQLYYYYNKEVLFLASHFQK